jgi:ubiquinone/menaquinone biosynthesis C-methylase UbiE
MMNQAEIDNWNGPVGERWAQFQEALDARIRVYGKDLLAKVELREGLRVLDVGCGCADMTMDAARAVGTTGRVVGVDVSRPMLARGRERARDLPNVELLEQDAATFSTDAPFDIVISRFGVMFFDDPAAAFANIRRATKDDGGLAFVCWQSLEKNPWAAVPLSAMLRVVAPPAATPNAPGPFALADPERVRDVLGRAGWSDVVLTPALHPLKLGATLDEAVEYASRMGPSARVLREVDDATRARAVEMLRETLAPFAPGFALDGAVWLVTARA